MSHGRIVADGPTSEIRAERLQLDASARLDQRELGMTWSPLGMTRTPTTLTIHSDLRPEGESAGSD